MDLVVSSRGDIADGVIALTLEDPGGRDLPGWTPGAHIDLVLSETLTRQYSLYGDPSDRRRWQIAVLRDPASRGGSAYVHDHLHMGTNVEICGPRNHFELVATERYVFIAGGIGITPILPMVVEADRQGADWTLLYGGRRRASMAFCELLSEFAPRVLMCPQDESGLLDLGSVLTQPRMDTLIYCCGPEPLMAAVEARCADWPAGSLHVERFAPVRSDNSNSVERAFQVRLERSGLTLEVPVGTSILEACLDAGVDVLSSCEEGTCGTCITRVLAGSPDHRDSVLSAAEREEGTAIAVCVSRSSTDQLVLDL